MLEDKIKEVESAFYHWERARQWQFDNPTICLDRDRRDVHRKLMKLDAAWDDLSRLVPEDVVAGETECPQEMARAVSVLLKAGAAMIGQAVEKDII